MVHRGMLGMRLEALASCILPRAFYRVLYCKKRKIQKKKKNYGKWRKIDGEKNLSFPWKNDSENCQQKLVPTTEPQKKMVSF